MDDVSVNFIELVALTKITPESTVEKFGSLINSSFFDASNILATLKQKGLVDFVTAFPSQSTLKLTDKGAALLTETKKRSTEPLDQLDTAILSQLGGGRRNLVELGAALNVAPKDLAVHIYKLNAQQNLTYELVNASVSMFLTEKGFVAAKNSAQAQQAATDTASAAANGGVPGQTQAQKNMDDEIANLEALSRKRRATRKMTLVVVAAVVVVLVILLADTTLFHL